MKLSNSQEWPELDPYDFHGVLDTSVKIPVKPIAVSPVSFQATQDKIEPEVESAIDLPSKPDLIIRSITDAIEKSRITPISPAQAQEKGLGFSGTENNADDDWSTDLEDCLPEQRVKITAYLNGLPLKDQKELGWNSQTNGQVSLNE